MDQAAPLRFGAPTRAVQAPAGTPAKTGPRLLSDEHGPWPDEAADPGADPRNVRMLLNAVEELYGPRPVRDLMRRAVDRAIRVTQAERGLLLLAGTDGRLQTVVARDAQGADLPLETRHSRSVVEAVWRSGDAALTQDAAHDRSPSLGASILELQLLSVMGAPLPVKGRSLGVLYVDSTVATRRFSESDFAVFKALGSLLALAAENARLLAQKAEQERMKRELLLARSVQQGLLPRTLPRPAGFELAGVWHPCVETSGDYYDVIPYDGDQLALVMGDVSGHGLGAALLMASTRALLHATLLARPEPAEVIRNANVFLERDTADETFMTMFLGALCPRRRELRYVNAGHNAPWLLRRDGTLETLPRTGPLLGMIPGARYGLSAPVRLVPGDALLLFTDGIVEAHDARGRMFGERRFQASFARHARSAASAQGVLDGIRADLDAFVGAQPFEDDVTALVVRAV